jgi:CheY-like chemotaxis protein
VDHADCAGRGVASLTKPVSPDELREALLAAVGRSTEQPAEEEAPPGPPAPGRRLRVLAAEDNVVNQRVIVRLLEKMGHQVRVVADGRQAVEAAESAEFDVVLMDCQMPEMDGFEATRCLRKSPRADLRNLPVIALTAHALKGDRERCVAAGMNDYLSKPVDAQELVTKLAALVPAAGSAGIENLAEAAQQGRCAEASGLADEEWPEAVHAGDGHAR